MSDEDLIQHEAAIIWREDPELLDYVRPIVVFRRRRAGPIRWEGPRLVGYSILRPDAPPAAPGMFPRRAFYLVPHDRAVQPDGPYRTGAPHEAVDPLTVEPRVWGELTARAARYDSLRNLGGMP